MTGPTHTAGHVPDIDSSYLDDFIDPIRLTRKVAFAVRALRPWIKEFDAIAFRGMSGALIAPPVMLALNKKFKCNKTLIMVRKPSDGSHACRWQYPVEGDKAAKSYIILDDFISSGETMRETQKAVAKFTNKRAKFIGLLEVEHLNEHNLRQHRGKKKYPLTLSYQSGDRVCNQ